MYGLIDCNNFYASCERVFRPDLKGKPVVVLSNNDGCVIARSNEAKAVGVPMGAPAFKYSRFFEQNQVHVFSSNYALYGDMSNRVMSLLWDFTPDVEVYSIDEAFFQLKLHEGVDLQHYVEEMRRKIMKSTGIPISIGIAPTKALSKVANGIAKKYTTKTGGVFVMDTDEKRKKVLNWLKIENVWGIGRRLTKRLHIMNVYNAMDFANLPDEFIRRNFSVIELKLKNELNGQNNLKLDDFSTKKSISTTRSFDRTLRDFDSVNERVATFAISCGEKLRKQNTYCNLLMVFVRTNIHRADLKQYKRNIVIKMDFPTNSSILLVKYASLGLKSIFKEGYEYKRAGVIVMELTPSDSRQLNLFKKPNLKHDALMKTMDKINTRYGDQKIKLAVQDQKKTWKMRQNLLSPKYTTKLADIITVNAE